MVGAGKGEGAMDAGRQHTQTRPGPRRACTASAPPPSMSTVSTSEKDAALERRFQKVLVEEPAWRTPSPSCVA